ncbi:hypothetical protein thalar_00467 [Litoreibacter arenae DSM 19593]|uniref:Uncharacterized protein n=1 Tax=Litoreibacter arenae DSM 19593 TaxID=1123360 RepID=S9QHT6_9RHOB|nr:hypothetical protein thalar_00467 [Litoreibacter arenae DSM 19593]
MCGVHGGSFPKRQRKILAPFKANSAQPEAVKATRHHSVAPPCCR